MSALIRALGTLSAACSISGRTGVRCLASAAAGERSFGMLGGAARAGSGRQRKGWPAAAPSLVKSLHSMPCSPAALSESRPPMPARASPPNRRRRAGHFRWHPGRPAPAAEPRRGAADEQRAVGGGGGGGDQEQAAHEADARAGASAGAGEVREAGCVGSPPVARPCASGALAGMAAREHPWLLRPAPPAQT